jgi:hypothetical protein
MNGSLRNRVYCNASKTQCSFISRKHDAASIDQQIKFRGEDLQLSMNLNILGMLLTPKLIWEEHLYKYYFSSTEFMKSSKSFIRSKMEDNSTIWAGASDQDLK